jgi:DNA-binding response OmpR family regulator
VSGTPARILVVEDDEILRLTLADILAEEGFEVQSAANGRAALEIISGWEPRLIILDLMMPQIDAFEFRRRQRIAGIAPDARILVLSAVRNLEVAAEEVGADAWLGKPFLLTEVLDTIDRLLVESAA